MQHKWGVYFGKPLSPPTWGQALRRVLLHRRASEEDAGPRRAVPALPAEARAGPKTAVKAEAVAAATVFGQRLLHVEGVPPRCASCYLRRPLTRLRLGIIQRAERQARAENQPSNFARSERYSRKEQWTRSQGGEEGMRALSVLTESQQLRLQFGGNF